MKTILRIGLACGALLLGSLPLVAQSSHENSRTQQERIDPAGLKRENRQSPSGIKSNARPAPPLVPDPGISRSEAGARISAATLETFNYSKSIVLWTVPANVYQITIEARGAQGGNVCGIQPGKGASITGTVAVTPGTQLKILVGQQGIDNGGGGGTFVTTSANIPLVIAGGGGGCGEVDSPNKEGQAGTSGGNGSSGGPYPGANEGFNPGFSGGQNGNGGGRGVTCNQNQSCWGSGGGLLTDGGNQLGGIAFVNGGIRVPGNSQSNFGGGGVGSYRATGGGGGGYSGGGSGGTGYYGGVGGGGGSFNAGTNPTNTGGVNTGNGSVKFTYTPCQPADASFTGLAANYCADAAAVTLVPTTAGGTFSGLNVVGNIFTPANAGIGGKITYSVTQNGCPASSSQNVTVNPLPTPAITDLSAAYCKDAGALTLTGTPSGGSFTIDGNSATQLDPASLSVGNHTVRYTVTENGCTAFTEQSVQIKALPTPAITGLSAAYCKDAGALTLTGTPSGGSFTIDGNSATQLDPASLSVGNHTVRYTVTENGCTAFTEQSVQIKALPTPAITGLSAAYCKDAGALTLTGTPSGGSFTIDGNSATQLDPASLSVGSHTVRYTVTENGCTAFTEQSVQIKALPTPAITGLSAAYCKDAGALTLTGTPSGGSFTIDGNSATQLDPASLSVGSHTVRYTVTENGCTAFTEQSVQIKALPTPAITGLSAAYCKDAGALTLTGTPSGGSFTIDGNSATQLDPASLSVGSHTVRYTVTVNGCTAFTEQSVQIKALPTPAITGLSAAYCKDAGALTLTGTPSGGSFTIDGNSNPQLDPASLSVGSHTVRYTVTVNGCANSTSQNVTVKPLPDAGFTGLAGPYCADAAAVTLVPTTAGGTFSGPGVSGNTFTPSSSFTGSTILYSITVDGCANSTSQNVTVNALPSVEAGNDKSVILGYPGPNSSCTNLMPMASGGSGGNYTYSWTTSNPADAPFFGPNPQVCPQVTTSYTVTVTDGNGCTASDQVTVNVKDVRCGPGGQNVKMCYYGLEICVPQSYVARYKSIGATIGSCGAANTRIGYEPETASMPLTLSLKAYPNPAQDAVTVEVLSRMAGEATFEVLDLTGRARQSRRQDLRTGLNEVKFQLGSLPAGIYLIRAVDGSGHQAVVRLSKE